VLRGFVTVLAIITILCAELFAHAGLRFSSPLEGATLGDTPSTVQLTLGEKPEPALSEIHVSDTSGAAYEVGRPASIPDDPLSLSVRVRPLGTGVYTVNWRVVSAVDGHASSGAYVFGVRASPRGVAARNASLPISRLEVVARWILIAGLVLMLGAACAEIARFGGPHDLSLAAAGWLLSIAGLALFATAQKQNARAALGDLLSTSVGRALIWRTAAMGAAAVALASAWWSARWSHLRMRRGAMMAVAVATLFAIAVHVAAGHAAAGPVATIVVQWAHFAAVGIWIGGLAALVPGIRGAASDIKATSVRRFSTIAGAGIVVVAASGVWRALNELASWNDLTTTAYGRAVLAKGALLLVIAVLGAINRWWNVPRALIGLGPLRMAARGELTLAVAALATAALLGTLPPPAAARLVPGITASGVDFGTTVRVSLSAASDQPGPNRFVTRIADYDSRKPVHADRVTLRFTPLDDPGLATTSLLLEPGPDDAYIGSGANLSFDGRWRVTVRVERAGNSVEVPIDVETRSLPQFASILRVPGHSPEYTVEVKGVGHVRISADPERAGRSTLHVNCVNPIYEPQAVDALIVTAGAERRPTRQLPVRPLDRSRFLADVDLQPGRNRIAVVARTNYGTRMRAVIEIDVARR
jgi:putative copper export protein/methionine-rich copper-binding protein CopC